MKNFGRFVAVAASMLVAVNPAMAAEAGEEVASGDAMKGLAAGLGLGIAAAGGAFGQSKAIAAGLEGIGRNPGAAGQIKGSLIIGLVLIESLVIYSLVVSLGLLGKF